MFLTLFGHCAPCSILYIARTVFLKTGYHEPFAFCSYLFVGPLTRVDTAVVYCNINISKSRRFRSESKICLNFMNRLWRSRRSDIVKQHSSLVTITYLNRSTDLLAFLDMLIPERVEVLEGEGSRRIMHNHGC